MPIVVYRKLMSGRFDQISGDLFDLTSLCNSRTPISSRYIEHRVFNERLPIHLADIKKIKLLPTCLGCLKTRELNLFDCLLLTSAPQAS